MRLGTLDTEQSCSELEKENKYNNSLAIQRVVSMEVRLNTDGNRFDTAGNRLETRMDTLGRMDTMGNRFDTVGNRERLDTRVDLPNPDNYLLTDMNTSKNTDLAADWKAADLIEKQAKKIEELERQRIEEEKAESVLERQAKRIAELEAELKKLKRNEEKQQISLDNPKDQNNMT